MIAQLQHFCRPAWHRAGLFRRPIQGAGWALTAVFLVALSSLHDAARAAETAAPDSAVQLLYDIQQAARKQDYAGVFMYQQGEAIQSSRLVHVIDGTGERERLEILDGQPREYLRHNDEIQCLIPERKTVLMEPRRGDRFPGLLLGNPTELAQHYDIRVQDKLHRVADRQCRIITIQPRDGQRYGYRLCADVATNLLLRAQTVDSDQRVVEQVSFSSIRLGDKVDANELTSPWNTRDWKVLQPKIETIDLAAQGWRIPAPAGFVSVMQVVRSMGRSNVSQLVLSDGLAAISVFIEPYDDQRDHPMSNGAVRRGAINIYSTRIADFWLTALGEVPAETLEQLATSTEYVPVSSQ
ncbi:MucB/RseB C-terminal domain-containing protein [Bordetella genomosp. 4]|uniref:Siderophore-interacting protein n=1 Tax=Bordetella genomosp. 4 TaxID=463044 RepID=A0A261UBF1_9BORD|nr:siderophore-interacting protein [Bordetella genomosp. 4]OZI58173.1 siderophore-interacting protein [Bordetella genomosp. 4]